LKDACRLKIQTDAFRLELSGDAAFVRAGYERLRDEILVRLAALHGGVGAGVEDPTVRLEPAEETGAQGRVPEQGPQYLWVYRCTDLFNKVYVLERRNLARTGLGRLVDVARLHRIYLEADDDAALEPLIPHGKTLWSELTSLGHRRLRAG
jgi:hypothetical protein